MAGSGSLEDEWEQWLIDAERAIGQLLESQPGPLYSEYRNLVESLERNVHRLDPDEAASRLSRAIRLRALSASFETFRAMRLGQVIEENRSTARQVQAEIDRMTEDPETNGH